MLPEVMVIPIILAEYPPGSLVAPANCEVATRAEVVESSPKFMLLPVALLQVGPTVMPTQKIKKGGTYTTVPSPPLVLNTTAPVSVLGPEALLLANVLRRT